MRAAFVGFLASEALLWSRAGRRRLVGAHLETRPSDPLEVVDQYGEVLQLVAALHQAITAVDGLVAETGGERPVSLHGDLTARVRGIRHAATHGVERISEPGAFNIRLTGDALVARSRGKIHQVEVAEVRQALDEIETWAHRELARLS